MLITYFKNPATLARCRSGLAHPYLEDFVVWLEQQGYRRRTICYHVCEVIHFANWAEAEGLARRDLNLDALDRLGRQMTERKALRHPSLDRRYVYQSARVFVSFLETIGAVDPPTADASAQDPALFLEFRAWMRTQSGTLDITLNNYRRPLLELLDELGSDPGTFDAKGLRAFLLRRVGVSGQAKSKNIATALRMFLRFLIARGRCAPGLEHAVPTVARWRLSSLPRYLPAEDVERLIHSCDPASLLGARDRAILLLIARLGLRASDVSALKFSDLLWEQGTLIVSGKNRRGTRLPLPQDAGEAILHYLRHRQPHKVSDSVFITVTAPFVPISRHVIRRVVMAALRRAGISAPTQGAHLLRHSVATRLLREGVSLSAIGVLLRHASIETTTLYAKVDVDLLREVALPWPEVQPC
jgi:integrase/recombinase XerD